MSADPQFAAGSGGQFSSWKLSELRDWFDLGFFDVNESQDVENYCAMIGAYEVLSWFRDVVPLVHGPLGCIASYSATRVQTRRCGQPRVAPYCTGMSAADAIRGGAAKLRQAIIDVDARERPRVIAVLPTCVPDVIGDDVAEVVREVAPRVEADVLHVPAAGSTCKGFRDGGELAFAELVRYVANRSEPVRRDDAPSVNLFTRRVSGKPSERADVHEADRLLGALGVKLNRVIGMGSTTADLAAAGGAWANTSFCFT